jgi:hypothetical protein
MSEVPLYVQRNALGRRCADDVRVGIEFRMRAKACPSARILVLLRAVSPREAQLVQFVG